MWLSTCVISIELFIINIIINLPFSFCFFRIYNLPLSFFSGIIVIFEVIKSHLISIEMQGTYKNHFNKFLKIYKDKALRNRICFVFKNLQVLKYITFLISSVVPQCKENMTYYFNSFKCTYCVELLPLFIVWTKIWRCNVRRFVL